MSDFSGLRLALSALERADTLAASFNSVSVQLPARTPSLDTARSQRSGEFQHGYDAAARLLDRNDQYTRDLSDAQRWLGNAENALTSTVTQLQKVNDLIVQASNSSLDACARQGIAAQIDSIRQSLIGVADTQYAARPIFAGTAGGDVAYDATGKYVGDSFAVERNIAPGQRIQVDVNGDADFGPPHSDVFSTLTKISQAVLSDPTQLSTLQTTLGSQTTQVGSQFLRVQNTQSQNTSDGLTMKQNLSSIEDADVAQVMVQLQAQLVAYPAALEATAKAIQPSLTDFLK